MIVVLGGIYEPDDGHVDPSLATNAMAKVAQVTDLQRRQHDRDPEHDSQRRQQRAQTIGQHGAEDESGEKNHR